MLMKTDIPRTQPRPKGSKTSIADLILRFNGISKTIFFLISF